MVHRYESCLLLYGLGAVDMVAWGHLVSSPSSGPIGGSMADAVPKIVLIRSDFLHPRGGEAGLLVQPMGCFVGHHPVVSPEPLQLLTLQQCLHRHPARESAVLARSVGRAAMVCLWLGDATRSRWRKALYVWLVASLVCALSRRPLCLGYTAMSAL